MPTWISGVIVPYPAIYIYIYIYIPTPSLSGPTPLAPDGHALFRCCLAPSPLAPFSSSFSSSSHLSSSSSFLLPPPPRPPPPPPPPPPPLRRPFPRTMFSRTGPNKDTVEKVHNSRNMSKLACYDVLQIEQALPDRFRMPFFYCYASVARLDLPCCTRFVQMERPDPPAPIASSDTRLLIQKTHVQRYGRTVLRPPTL